MIKQLRFRRIPGTFGICRLPPDVPTPPWAQAGFTSITRTSDELSIVTKLENFPQQHKPNDTWTALKLEGPFAFSEVAVLASFIQPLAAAGVPLFAISTFDTDYVLVQQGNTHAALNALREAGHQLLGD